MKVKTSGDKVEDSKFPAFFRSGSGDVVLFIDKSNPYAGIHISGGDENFGEYYEGYTSCLDDSVWARLPEGFSVTITQE